VLSVLLALTPSDQILVRLHDHSVDVDPKSARQEIWHYARNCPREGKVQGAIEAARVIAHGDPITDLQALESLAQHCQAAGHYLRVFRMSADETVEALVHKAEVQHQQEVRSEKQKAAKQNRSPRDLGQFNRATVERRYV
jgi:hypothetical protein